MGLEEKINHKKINQEQEPEKNQEQIKRFGGKKQQINKEKSFRVDHSRIYSLYIYTSALEAWSSLKEYRNIMSSTSTSLSPSSQSSSQSRSFDWMYMPGISDILPLICSHLTRDDVQNLYMCSKHLKCLIQENTGSIVGHVKWKQPHMKLCSHRVISDQHTFIAHGLMVDGERHGVWTSSRGLRLLTYRFGLLHSTNDQPAYTCKITKVQRWYNKGQLHRDNDLPAEVQLQSDRRVMINAPTPRFGLACDHCHKLSQQQPKRNGDVSGCCMKILSKEVDQRYLQYIPQETRDAIIADVWNYSFNGISMKYYQHGKLHREGDRPADISNTKIAYYKYGKLHRSPIYQRHPNETSGDMEQLREKHPRETMVVVPAVVYFREHRIGAQFFIEHDFRDSRNDIPAVIYADGSMEWYQNNGLHRDNDKPAIIMSDGTCEWYRWGQLHRDNDQPAIIQRNGQGATGVINCWVRAGTRIHAFEQIQPQARHSNAHYIREMIKEPSGNMDRDCYAYRAKLIPQLDSPLVAEDEERMDGTRKWYTNGHLHRDNDLPAIIDTSGTKEWYQNGVLHRIHDRPAIEHKDGRCEWICQGVRHRSEGPAVTWPDGSAFYFRRGCLHRDQNLPAIELSTFYPTCHVVWYINGLEIRKMKTLTYHELTKTNL